MNTVRCKMAFTLVEMIVSLAITSVIAVFVFSFATSLAKLWRSTESGMGTELDAQIVLDLIARDLESAVFQERFNSSGGYIPMFAVSAISKDGTDIYKADLSGRWVYATNASRPADLHFDPEYQRYGWAGSWLRFFTAAPSFNAISYQIIRRSPFSATSDPKYLLHRSVVVNSNTTAGGFDIATGSGSAAATLKSPNLTSVVLEDVVDFGVRLYVYEATAPATVDCPRGLRLIFPAASGNLLNSNDKEHLASRASGGTYSERYPDLVEIFIRVLDDVGSDQLLQLEEGVSDLKYDDIIESHSRVYRRMVKRPGREPAVVQ